MAKRFISPVDPVLRIPDIPVDSKFLVDRALRKYEQFETDRIQWLRRREEFYLGWDDYMTPIRKGLWDSSSNVHLPLIEIKSIAMHARIMQAAFGIYPPFYVDPQEDLDIERIKKIEAELKYIVMRGANYNKGIYNAIDDWAWDLTTDGMGILSRDWRVEQRRFVTVEDNQQFQDLKVDLDKLLGGEIDEKEFSKMANDAALKPYIEKYVIRTVFNGSIVAAEDPTYILFKGDVVDATDLNAHETVIKVCYFSRSELMTFKMSDYFDEEVVDKILAGKSDKKGSTAVSMRTSRLNAYKDEATGVRTQNSSNDDDVYEFLCVYDTVYPTGEIGKKQSMLPERLVYFVHPASQQLARWTFLDRISANGKLNLHMAHLYRRPRRSIGRGLVETQYPMNEVLDLLVNQSIDSGMLANNPMGAYKGGSQFDPNEIRVEPGLLVKTDNPNEDIRFFNWPVNPNWSLPIQGMINSFSDQLTSIGPADTGQVGARVGAGRSTSGLRELSGNADVQRNVLIKRAMSCLSELFEGLYSDNVERMPQKFRIPLIGYDGDPLLDENGSPIRIDATREELRARVNFGIYANSSNMNRDGMKAAAMQMMQFSMQPALIQSGVVSAKNLYELTLNLHRALGTNRADRFVTMPTGAGAMSIQAELGEIMQGIVPTVVLADPAHEEKIQMFEQLLSSEKASLEVKYGMVHPQAMKILKATLDKHVKFLEVANRPSNMGNPTGLNINPTLGADETGRPAGGGMGGEGGQGEGQMPPELMAAQGA